MIQLNQMTFYIIPLLFNVIFSEKKHCFEVIQFNIVSAAARKIIHFVSHFFLETLAQEMHIMYV